MKNELERRQIVVTPEVPVSLEPRAEGSAELPKIVGYSAVFGVDAEIGTYFGSFRERIQKGAFKRAIREGQNVRALRNHDPDNLLGTTAAKTVRLKEDDTGLFIEIDTPDTTIGRDTAESVKRGDLSGMSFAFIVRKEKWINGEDGSPDMRIIQDVDLFDVGPVTYPAYTQTTADARSSSKAHQLGMAELGKPVPRLPEEGTETEAKREKLPELTETEEAELPEFTREAEPVIEEAPAFDTSALRKRQNAMKLERELNMLDGLLSSKVLDAKLS